MSTVFFDIGHVRNNVTVCRNKNHSSVLPLKPMTFLVKRNPTALSEKSAGYCRADANLVQKADKSNRNLKIYFITLHQINMMK